VVFGVPAHELFRGIFAEVEKIVTERARRLSAHLKQDREEGLSVLSRRKLATLSAILRRGEAAPA
jgi:hypothetical protein